MTGTKGENLTERLKKIKYRAHHRGTQEMDIILGGFVDQNVSQMNEVELDQLEELMAEQDVDLLNWITGASPIDEAPHKDLLQRIAAFQLKRVGTE